MIILHSYTFRDYSLETVFAKAKEYGYEGVELYSGFWKGSFAAMLADLQNTLALSSRYGVPVRAVGFSTPGFAAPVEQWRQEMERLQAAVPVLRAAGVTMMNGYAGFLAGADPSAYSSNGSVLAGPEHYERAAGALQGFAKAAQAEGLTITLEVHMNTIHDSVKSALRLIELVGSPAIRINLDPGNMLPIAHAEPAVAAVGAAGSRLGYVHLKNCRLWQGSADYSVLLAGGHIDYRKVLGAITQAGYRGDYCIEYCGLGDPAVAARQDREYLSALLAELQ